MTGFKEPVGGSLAGLSDHFPKICEDYFDLTSIWSTLRAYRRARGCWDSDAQSEGNDPIQPLEQIFMFSDAHTLATSKQFCDILLPVLQLILLLARDKWSSCAAISSATPKDYCATSPKKLLSIPGNIYEDEEAQFVQTCL
ncbi:hypothetical protein ACJX0J_030759, partial [Zea mays]